MDTVSTDDLEEREVVSGVHNTAVLTGEQTNLLRFRIEPNGHVPEHSHPHEQIGYIVSGEATFTADGETRILKAGDAYRLPGDEPHQLENRGDDVVIGIDVFSPPRGAAPFAEDEQ
ncbi:cupin domain-containing protein [Natronomonas sp.]|uniref:cupin domain-containing protein n=1 Tax=Natronomonas sp. TaxID=2184060 RepID=UPI0039762AB5